MKRNKIFVTGLVFGLIAPIMGFFLGMFVSPVLGTVFTFPIVIIGNIIKQPFGMFSTWLLIFSFIFSMLCWGGIFILAKKIVSKFKK